MNMEYKTFFGKTVTHEEAIKEGISSLIVDILIKVNSISEKDFKKYDEQIHIVKNFIDENTFVIEMANDFVNNKKRLELLAEQIYDEYFNVQKIEEKSKFNSLKDNKKPLSKEERDIVKQGKAEWSDGRSAVWKSVNKKGKKTFVSNTHRAYNTAPTLKGIIKKFHEFIKSTD